MPSTGALGTLDLSLRHQSVSVKGGGTFIEEGRRECKRQGKHANCKHVRVIHIVIGLR